MMHKLMYVTLFSKMTVCVFLPIRKIEISVAYLNAEYKNGNLKCLCPEKNPILCIWQLHIFSRTLKGLLTQI